MGFDMNPSMFPPRPQLYDTHVPLVPSSKPRQNKRPNNKQKQNQKNQNQNQQNQTQQNQTQQSQNETQSKPPEKPEENGAVARKKEELDELALLGIDAGDVAGM